MKITFDRFRSAIKIVPRLNNRNIRGRRGDISNAPYDKVELLPIEMDKGLNNTADKMTAYAPKTTKIIFINC